MDVQFVVKHLKITRDSVFTLEFTVEKSHMIALSVVEVSTTTAILPSTREFTMRINHMLVLFAVKNAEKDQVLKNI